MNKTIKNIALWLTGMSAIASINANAQNLDIEFIKSLEPKHSYVRPNATYTLPAGIKGYTFAELYSDGNSYFSKTNLTKSLTDNVAIMGQGVTGSGFDDHAGLGVSATIPTPENTFAKAYIIPTYVASDGSSVKNKTVAGFYAEANLPLDFKVSSFGEVNITGTKGAEWMYGELNVEKKFDNVSVSYNPALLNKKPGTMIPTIEHRFTVKYTFK